MRSMFITQLLENLKEEESNSKFHCSKKSEKDSKKKFQERHVDRKTQLQQHCYDQGVCFDCLLKTRDYCSLLKT